MRFDLSNDIGYRRFVVGLLGALVAIEAARGIAESRRVVIIAGDVDVNNTVSVQGAVDAQIVNRELGVRVANIPLFVTGR